MDATKKGHATDDGSDAWSEATFGMSEAAAREMSPSLDGGHGGPSPAPLARADADADTPLREDLSPLWRDTPPPMLSLDPSDIESVSPVSTDSLAAPFIGHAPPVPTEGSPASLGQSPEPLPSPDWTLLGPGLRVTPSPPPMPFSLDEDAAADGDGSTPTRPHKRQRTSAGGVAAAVVPAPAPATPAAPVAMPARTTTPGSPRPLPAAAAAAAGGDVPLTGPHACLGHKTPASQVFALPPRGNAGTATSSAGVVVPRLGGAHGTRSAFSSPPTRSVVTPASPAAHVRVEHHATNAAADAPLAAGAAVVPASASAAVEGSPRRHAAPAAAVAARTVDVDTRISDVAKHIRGGCWSPDESRLAVTRLLKYVCPLGHDEGNDAGDDEGDDAGDDEGDDASVPALVRLLVALYRGLHATPFHRKTSVRVEDNAGTAADAALAILMAMDDLSGVPGLVPTPWREQFITDLTADRLHWVREPFTNVPCMFRFRVGTESRAAINTNIKLPLAAFLRAAVRASRTDATHGTVSAKQLADAVHAHVRAPAPARLVFATRGDATRGDRAGFQFEFRTDVMALRCIISAWHVTPCVGFLTCKHKDGHEACRRATRLLDQFKKDPGRSAAIVADLRAAARFGPGDA